MARNMKYIKLKYRGRSYHLSEDYANKLYLLAYFLLCDVTSSSESFIDWLKDPAFDYTTSNFAFLEKEGDIIIIGRESAENEYEDIFEIKVNNLIAVLEKWKKLYKEKPKEIIITYDGQHVDLIGKD